MSVMSTGRRPGAGVRRLSPEDAYPLQRQPGPADSKSTARRRPARPRLRLVPPLSTRPAEGRPPAPPRGRISVPADTRVPAPRAVSVPSAAPAPAPAAPSAAPTASAQTAARAQVAAPARPAAPARVAAAAQVAAPARVAPSARLARPGGTTARIVRPAGVPARRRKVRLTRRGRVVVWVLAALVAAAVLTPVWLIAATGAQAANHGLPPAAVHAGMRHVLVEPGQTLWSIAMAAEPTADPRVVTQEIMQVNALSSGVVVPGESLWVPAS